MMANNTEDKPTPRKRWDLLSKALQKKSTSADTESKPHSASVRRFESFGLIQLNLISTYNHNNDRTSTTHPESHHQNRDLILDGKWFECKLWNQTIKTFDRTVAEIKLLDEKIPINELTNSSDNTGNVCLWPSEEVLTYYILKNSNLCLRKTVLELGGGMTCLCSLVAAVSTAAKRVILTDGNQRCVSNVRQIVSKNVQRLRSSAVECRQLVWGQTPHYDDLYNQIDVILCADCLYFDDCRQQLVDTVFKLLNKTGIAILLAPTRGTTFNSFVDLAKVRFDIEIIENYDQLVSDLHKRFVESAVDSHYVPDLHYPVMIRLRHKSIGTAKHY